MAARVSEVLMKRRYVTADVFTREMFGGNPLAVVLDAEGLSTAQMQAIALSTSLHSVCRCCPATSAW
jgi:trans-2,3-dihydro-3-hydroxyanthranilate isomerase